MSGPGQKSVVYRLILWADAISTFAGRLSSWLILALTFLISWEVFSRYMLGKAHTWVFDTSYMLYGTVLLIAGAYTLAKDGHIRGDLLYSAMPPRAQAAFDLVLYPLFFIPGVLALLIAGYSFAETAVLTGERSSLSPGGPPVWPLRAAIPLAAALLLLQGLAEILRAIVCLVTGSWPPRPPDVGSAEELLLRTKDSPDNEGARP